INEPFIQRSNLHYRFRSLPNNAKKVMIIGAGPAGLFAALELILLGIKPIIIERGKDVKARRRDLAA
ncbi:FAD-dependent monooxygenase, partial [Serratia marcescens]|uniref:FAD-dependent monooxygenase n=1 Tax=Serratia marcescens TaxID=615 RepID=UPI0019547655